MIDKRKDKGSEIDAALVYGKVPPQSKMAEQAILGAILLEKSAFEKASELLTADCFYVDAHQRIFEAMQALSRSGRPIDIITVVDQLTGQGVLESVGGPYYVTTLTNVVVSSHHLEAHARSVFEKYKKRQMIQLGSDMVAAGYDEGIDAFEMMDDFEGQLAKVTEARGGNTTVGLSTVIVQQMSRIYELQQQGADVTGIPSGFSVLDGITHGWQNTDLIILAARPAVGKTAFALNLALNGAGVVLHLLKKVTAALIFSLEMSAGQLVNRILSMKSEIWLEKIVTGQMEESHLKLLYASGVQKLADHPVYIDDTAALNVFEFRSRVRTLKRKLGPKAQLFVILDYLQLMTGVGDKRSLNREQEISLISRNLKIIAKEEDIPIIALSQLSRAVEQRGAKEGSKVPQLSDLRESGAIEQDADTVMFLYRPEYYDINQSAEGESVKGLTELSIAKHRHGKLDTVKLKALLHIQKFVPWDGLEQTKSQLGSGAWRPISESGNSDLSFL